MTTSNRKHLATLRECALSVLKWIDDNVSGGDLPCLYHDEFEEQLRRLIKAAVPRESLPKNDNRRVGVIITTAGRNFAEHRRFRPGDLDADKIERIRVALRGLAGVTEEASVAPGRHSKDFRSVQWHGQDFPFTSKQADIVRALWEAMDNGTPELGGDTLLEACDSSQQPMPQPGKRMSQPRVSAIFRKADGSYHPAWNTMIVSGKTKNTFRLSSSQ